MGWLHIAVGGRARAFCSWRGPLGLGMLHGLKLVAVAVVGQAVWGMARTLCADWQRASIAAVVALLYLFSSTSTTQVWAIILGGIAGLWLCRGTLIAGAPSIAAPVSRTAAWIALAIFTVLLIGPTMLRGWRLPAGAAQFEAFYRSGALVFGGGHVVLPLLRDAFVTPGWVSDDTFLAGYGAAQAVPGPLFSFAAYLGAVVRPSSFGIAGAALGLMGIFLPGMLVLIGTLPFWDALRSRTNAQAAMRGINAAVVGLLGAALYNPVWSSSVTTPADLGVALIGYVLLTVWRAPPLLVVITGALGGIALVK